MISTFALFLAAATAQPVTGTASPGAKPAADPIVCERVKEVGSMLRSKKVCMTRSQWAEQRRGDRSNLERSQTQRVMNGN